MAGSKNSWNHACLCESAMLTTATHSNTNGVLNLISEHYHGLGYRNFCRVETHLYNRTYSSKL